MTSQIAGWQATALLWSYALSQAWSASAELLQSLIDSSGVLAVSAVRDFSENVTFTRTAYLAYGLGPLGAVPRSQFGAIPPTLLLQVKLYD